MSSTKQTAETRTDPEPSDSNTLMNALIGGIVGVVLSMIPFSTILGGAVAGYLEGGTTNDALRVGAYAGVVMLIPIVLFGSLGLLFFTGMPIAGGSVGVGVGGFMMMTTFILVILTVAIFYTVALGMLGGWIGNYLKANV